MTKLFDYEPIEENTLVDRILLRVHKSIDEAFPKAVPAVSRRFAKTIFADEPTINQPLPTDVRSFLNAEAETPSGVSRYSQDHESSPSSIEENPEDPAPRTFKQNVRRFFILLGIFVLTTLILYWSRL